MRPVTPSKGANQPTAEGHWYRAGHPTTEEEHEAERRRRALDARFAPPGPAKEATQHGV